MQICRKTLHRHISTQTDMSVGTQTYIYTDNSTQTYIYTDRYLHRHICEICQRLKQPTSGEIRKQKKTENDKEKKKIAYIEKEEQHLGPEVGCKE